MRGDFQLAKVSPSSRLQGVNARFDGATYNDLSEPDRRGLDNSLIHGTVVRQDEPNNDDSSMYLLFERLNSGGRHVYPQEIRSAVYQGSLINAIKAMNDEAAWRLIVGKPSIRMRDQEIILRFMAMFHRGDHYSNPMVDFLNDFLISHRNPAPDWLTQNQNLFKRVISAFADAKGREAFRLRGSHVVNAAVFDSMSVGLATRIAESDPLDLTVVATIHDELIDHADYLDVVTSSTSRDHSVKTRLGISKAAFADA